MKLIRNSVSAQGVITLRETERENGYGLFAVPSGTALLKEAGVSFSFDFQRGDALFLNGYQSWTFSPERGVKDFDKSMRFCPGFLDKRFGFSKYGDGHFYPHRYKKGVMHGYSYAYVRRGGTFTLFASLSEKSGFTRIIFDTRKNTVTFQKDCAGREISDGFTLFDLLFITGSENEVFDAYFKALGIEKPTASPASGYTSWYNCYQNISEERILSDLDGLSRLPVRPDVFQIDDGFEPFVGDWLSCDPKKFPNGTKPIAERITALGFTAGIWLAPFVCEKDSALFSERPDLLLRDANGEPVYCGCNWSGAYALDFYNEDVRDYIKRAVEKYRDEGFSLFKLDFLYAACMLPRRDKTRGEIMDEAMSFLRKTCGDALVIGCGVPLAPAYGRVDYCRIGPDISLSFDDKPFMRLFHAERPSTKHAMQNTLFRRELSGRAFLNDPDVFILRDDNTSLTDAQKTALGTVNALFGGLLFASDEFSKYTDEKTSEYASLVKLLGVSDASVSVEKGRTVLRWSDEGEEKTFTL